MPLVSRMEIKDKPVQVGLKCAVCNQPVASGEQHKCKGENNESSLEVRQPEDAGVPRILPS